MINFAQGKSNTVISTHISPTSFCNLDCEYCSTANRKGVKDLPLDLIIDYIDQLVSRGLKSIIFSGGGEPTLYKHWTELMKHFRNGYKLKYGLITNGVNSHYRDLSIFDWIRVSFNYQAKDKINLDKRLLKKGCTVGSSLIYSHINKKFTIDELNHLVSRIGADYMRILPNCLPADLGPAHKEIDEFLNDPSRPTQQFFHQMKHHSAPNVDYCTQVYFRPYLSEVDGGSVFPCDSIVLNDHLAEFNSKYIICKAGDVGKFLDGEIKQQFLPQKDCTGCVFHENVEMLRDWKIGKSEFHKYTKPIKHEDFI